MNATQRPGHETQNAEAQTALTETALEKINEGHENPSQLTRAGSAISGLNIDQNWDAGSAVGTERVSSTDSVWSSINNYVEPNGQQYHKYKESKYYFLNNKNKQDRLNPTAQSIPIDTGR
jgi:hypothetical protein